MSSPSTAFSWTHEPRWPPAAQFHRLLLCRIWLNCNCSPWDFLLIYTLVPVRYICRINQDARVLQGFSINQSTRCSSSSRKGDFTANDRIWHLQHQVTFTCDDSDGTLINNLTSCLQQKTAQILELLTYIIMSEITNRVSESTRYPESLCMFMSWMSFQLI